MGRTKALHIDITRIELLGDEDVITVDEAAKLMGISSNTVRTRIKSGELFAKKINGVWLTKGKYIKVLYAEIIAA